eukprot:2267382-Pyramimonas_sp.AAC.1
MLIRVNGIFIILSSHSYWAGHDRNGTFSTPWVVRRRWSLSAAAIRAGRPGRSRRGTLGG